MKNKFIKSTIVLIIGGFFTKILGMIIKIVMTRIIGTEGIGIYSLINPTFMLLLALSQLGLPTALNVLIAKGKNTKNLLSSAILISLFIDFIIFIFLFISSKYLATNLLSEKRAFLGLLSMGFIFPFISVSNMFRSYYFAKERMFPHVITNILEDIVKLLLLSFLLPKFLLKGIEYAIQFIVLTNIASELTSIIIFIFLFPKFSLNKKDIIPKKDTVKNLFGIALPTTGSRLIGSIGYFLEPIIMTYVLIKIGYDNSFIVNEYGIINGYVMPLILLPSFFTAAISQALIPNISKGYQNKNYSFINKRIKQAIYASLLIGVPATLIFTIIPEVPLKFIYNTNQGINYIKFLAPICLLHYIQSPLSSSLQAMNKAKISLKGTLYGMIIRSILLFLLSYLKIGMWGLILSISINIIFVTTYDYIKVKSIIKNNQ